MLFFIENDSMFLTLLCSSPAWDGFCLQLLVGSPSLASSLKASDDGRHQELHQEHQDVQRAQAALWNHLGEKGFFGNPISHLIRRYRIGPCELCPAVLRRGGGLRHDHVFVGGTPEHDDMGVSSCERISTIVRSACGDASVGPYPRVP